MEARTKAINTLKKLYAKRVSVLGTANCGEVFAIDNAIANLLEKWGIQPSEIESTEKRQYRFTYANNWESRVLFQVIFQVTQLPTIGVNYRHAKTRLSNNIGIDLTEYEHKEIKKRFKALRKDPLVTLDNAVSAFIHANKIYGVKTDGEEKEVDEKELEKILAMMGGITPTDIPITDKNRLLGE